MQGSTELNTRVNVAFVCADIAEQNLIDAVRMIRHRAGGDIRQEVKRDFNTAMAAIKRLRGYVNKCNDATQENFGNDADMLNAVLLTIIDRAGDDDMLLFKIYNQLKAMPSKGLLTLEVDGAFKHILQNE